MISADGSNHRTSDIQHKLQYIRHTLRSSHHRDRERCRALHVVGSALASAFSHKANIRNRWATAARKTLQFQQHSGGDRLQGP